MNRKELSKPNIVTLETKSSCFLVFSIHNQFARLRYSHLMEQCLIPRLCGLAQRVQRENEQNKAVKI